MGDFLISLVAFLFVIGVLVVLHELGHFLTARLFNVKVEEFAFGLPPRIIAWKKGETEYAINALPIGGYVKLLGEEGEKQEDPRSFSSKKPWQRFVVLAAGSTVHFILAIVIFAGIFLINGKPVPNDSIVIASVNENSPAQEAGIASGDIVLTIAGKDIASLEDFVSTVSEYSGTYVPFLLQRGENLIELSTTPRTNPPAGEGSLGVIVTNDIDLVKVNFFQAIGEGVYSTFYVVKTTLDVVGQMVRDIFTRASIPAEIQGPVGVAGISGEIAKQRGFGGIMSLMGILAANLAIFNLLPFPGLDGGRLIFVALEALRGGKKLPQQMEATVHAIGILLLLALIAVISFRDVLNIFN